MRYPGLFFQFLFSLTLLCGLAVSGHLSVLAALELPLNADLLPLSYVVNFGMAALIFLSLLRLRKKLKNQIGFLFMAGSMFKFLLFFLVFYGPYKEDGSISRSEFAAFFIPYAVCLIAETFFTARMLQEKPGGSPSS